MTGFTEYLRNFHRKRVDKSRNWHHIIHAIEGTKEVTLLFWTHEDPNRTPLEEGYIKEFQKKYPNVTIKGDEDYSV